MKLKGTKGQYLIRDKYLKSGGEGAVFDILMINNQNFKDIYVAKIYHNTTLQYDKIKLKNKIIFMVNNPPDSNVLDKVTWPLDILFDKYNNFVGFTMKKFHKTELLSVVYRFDSNSKNRNHDFDMNKNRLIVAQNICVVIQAYHDKGYIFGDFNPQNIGIKKNGEVVFFDADSVHIVQNGFEYRCKVACDEYLAPELIAAASCSGIKNNPWEVLKLPTFTKETDNFALAIHIFKLLFLGISPYSGVDDYVTKNTSKTSPGRGIQAIRNDAYCFKPGKKPMATYLPNINIYPERIQNLFKDAFIFGRNYPKKRPNAKQWYEALNDYSNQLSQCTKNKYHQYYSNLSRCPWCKAENQLQNKLNKRTFPHAQYRLKQILGIFLLIIILLYSFYTLSLSFLDSFALNDAHFKINSMGINFLIASLFSKSWKALTCSLFSIIIPLILFFTKLGEKKGSKFILSILFFINVSIAMMIEISGGPNDLINTFKSESIYYIYFYLSFFIMSIVPTLLYAILNSTKRRFSIVKNGLKIFLIIFFIRSIFKF